MVTEQQMDEWYADMFKSRCPHCDRPVWTTEDFGDTDGVYCNPLCGDYFTEENPADDRCPCVNEPRLCER
jgi:hypothetical protein